MNPTDRLQHVVLLDWQEAARLGPGVAGGKGTQIGRLARYGLPVTDGCVVATDVYRAAMAGELHETALGVCALAADSQNSALEKVRKRILEQPLASALSMALDQFLTSKGWIEQPLAVRSSAPAEDSAHASFAGIHRSVLNVMGRAALADAIRAVWASLWTPQAVAYRERIGMPHEDSSMAVVVMPMIPAKASGVVFTCDPRSGREDRIVISGVRGLGEALVSGLVSGEDIVLGCDRAQEVWTVIERQPASATIALESDVGGGVSQRQLTQEEQTAPVLDNSQALALGVLARDVANAFDFSAPWYDIEWVWDGSRFLVVQARPITARPWHTYPALQGQASIWTNGNSREVVPHVINACDFQGMKAHANFLLQCPFQVVRFPVLDGAQRATLIQGRLYFNVAIMQWEAYSGFGVPPQMYNRSLGGHQPEISVPAPTLRQKCNHALYILRFLGKSAAMRRQGLTESQRVFSESKEWCKTDWGTLTNSELVERREDFGASYLPRHLGLAFMQCSGSGYLQLLERLELKFPGESNFLAAALLAGGTPSVTAQQGYDLLQLASLACMEPPVTDWLRAGHHGDWRELPPDSKFRAAFGDFLDQYGHRGVYESYSRSPRWREDPSFLLASVAGLLDANVQDIYERQRKALTSAWQHITSRTSWIDRWMIRLLQRMSRRDNNQRELARSSFTAILGWARLMLLEVGRRLAADGLLNQRDEVFHLTIAEQTSALLGRLPRDAIQARIADRVKMAEYWEANPAPDVVIKGGNGAADPAPNFETANQADTWRGVAVGSGYAEGKVRIVTHPNEHARLQRGDILVAPSTDPSWLPLFLKAGGLIIETGGHLSHGAIVAREFGIPAVVNLPGIMAQLRDGELVAVDGQRGMVVRLDSDESDKVHLQK